MLINFFLGAASFLELVLGVIIFGQREKGKELINISFGLDVLVVSAWVFSALMFRLVSGSTIMFWCKTQYVIGAIVAAGFLFFTYIFPEGKIRIGRWKQVIILAPLIALITMIYWPGAFVKQINIAAHGKDVFFGAISYPIYGLFIVFYFTLAFWNLIKIYLKRRGLIREQLNYFILGTGLTAVSAITFDIILPWFKYFYFWAGTISSLAMVGFIGYAILKKELFGIKIILTEILVSLTAILLLVDVFLSESRLEYLWRGALFLLFVFFGFLLIKSVLKEIKLKNQLAAANEELKKLDKIKSEFLSIASHQLRAPLTIIKGYSSMMLEGDFGKLNEKIKDVVYKMFQSTQGLVLLVEDFLNIGRIEMGQMKYDFADFDLSETVKRVVDEFAADSKKTRGLKLSFESDGGNFNIKADQNKIRQVVYNLIDNAVKYTEKGFVKVFLAHHNKNHKNLLLKIQDSGEGISKEMLSKIFQKFSRESGASRLHVDGSGLGLYVAKKIVEDHGGKIWVESDGKGRGSSFFIELPLNK
ncbi:hypothetical protein KKB69_00975 [Patescibacteria group bacterium]|nr:hypothetical protein [Patescibacteria group bacterium]